MIAGKSAKQIFTASLFCALRSCIIDGFAKTSLQANVFASWYNKHNAKDEKRDRFSVMCLLNRSEASRFAACTYGIISTRPPSARRMNPPGLRPSLAAIESSFGKRGALTCDAVAHFTCVKCECGIIISEREVKGICRR